MIDIYAWTSPKYHRKATKLSIGMQVTVARRYSRCSAGDILWEGDPYVALQLSTTATSRSSSTRPDTTATPRKQTKSQRHALPEESLHYCAMQCL